jgi:amidohydrolase
MNEIQQLLIDAQDLFKFTQEIRRDIHQFPEMGFKEVRTSGIVAGELKNLGLEVQTGVAETGVVGILEGSSDGATILLRFDMDALPINEETDAPYSSKNPGVMHACGHDGHVAIGLTVARMLHNRRDSIKGRIKFIFQPAEEGMGGAERMIQEGILENPRPDLALSVHVWNEQPVGWFGISPGPVMAGGEIFKVKVIGKGGHGALPQSAVDPVIASAQIITALQTIVSRNIIPLEAAVVSVTYVKAGDVFNVIPPFAEFGGTIRTFDKGVRQIVLNRFGEVVGKVAEALGCQVEIELKQLTPALVNDPKVTEAVDRILQEIMPQATIERSFKTMGSEDMAYVLEKIPGCFVFVGSKNAEMGFVYGHHHPKFDIDERALINGAAIVSAAAMKILSNS